MLYICTVAYRRTPNKMWIILILVLGTIRLIASVNEDELNPYDIK